jgi:hypothetical protein
MRKLCWAILFVATLLSALPSRAQNPNYDVGPVRKRAAYLIGNQGPGSVLEGFSREPETGPPTQG